MLMSLLRTGHYVLFHSPIHMHGPSHRALRFFYFNSNIRENLPGEILRDVEDESDELEFAKALHVGENDSRNSPEPNAKIEKGNDWIQNVISNQETNIHAPTACYRIPVAPHTCDNLMHDKRLVIISEYFRQKFKYDSTAGFGQNTKGKP